MKFPFILTRKADVVNQMSTQKREYDKKMLSSKLGASDMA